MRDLQIDRLALRRLLVHDGWIDADDVPYEPPPVWERPVEDAPVPPALPKAEVGATYGRAAEAPVHLPAAADVRSPEAQPPVPGGGAVAPQIDLLA